jgi:hypothetical protein
MKIDAFSLQLVQDSLEHVLRNTHVHVIHVSSELYTGKLFIARVLKIQLAIVVNTIGRVCTWPIIGATALYGDLLLNVE